MVEDLVEDADFVHVRMDFESWEGLEHLIKGFLKTEERVEEIWGSRVPLVECGFHRVSMAREGLSDRRQAGVNSA